MAARPVKITQKKVEVGREGSDRIKDFYFCQLYTIFSSSRKKDKDSSANKDLLLNKNINFRDERKTKHKEISEEGHNRRAQARMCKV